ncbi:MAG: hypothetical protein NC099_01625 [Corallococcus sp.]|nr:hypothetical protein [Bacillota bacterium]MCM1533332.1 hypothetical protein [Corallococcus sp.]
MKKIFDKNDKYFKSMELIVLGVVAIVAICLFICFCFMMYNKKYLEGFLALTIGSFVIFVNFMFWKLIFSALKDLKFIRNKLYGLEESEAELIDQKFESNEDNE